jgi:hypothetical protein
MTLEQTTFNHTITITDRVGARFAYSFEGKIIATKTRDRRQTLFRSFSPLYLVLLVGLN